MRNLPGCYERMGTITTTPLHRGWRLLAAFIFIKRLDINQTGRRQLF